LNGGNVALIHESTMNFPEFLGVGLEELVQIEALDQFVFRVWVDTHSECKQNNGTREDVGSLQILDGHILQLRGSVILGALAIDSLISELSSEIKIDNFKLVSLTQHQVLELDVHVSDASLVKVFDG